MDIPPERGGEGDRVGCIYATLMLVPVAIYILALFVA